VLEALAELFPQADIFTLVLDPNSLSGPLRSRRIHTSFLQKLPAVKRYYRKLLPLFPVALEQLCVDGYDLVISSESGPAKGVITSSSTCHICYCHSPMRYLWDLYHGYRNGHGVGPLTRATFSLTAHYLRQWDLATASRVDYFVANSQNAANRIRKHYRRDACVIHPPVSVASGYLTQKIEDYYLVLSRLVDYKRVDLAIEACNRLGRPLRIIGGGEEYKRLRRMAGPHISFLGFLPDEAVRENLAHCRALLFPGDEDFGIVPVEAQSFGRPVIAFGRGGVLETVDAYTKGNDASPEHSTGIFFHEQSAESLMEAIRVFESVEPRFSPSFIRSHAQRFDIAQFKAEMGAFISSRLKHFQQASQGLALRAGN
jgi:glycosyltransferase involved in cell wall biosynthesis